MNKRNVEFIWKMGLFNVTPKNAEGCSYSNESFHRRPGAGRLIKFGILVL